MLHLGETVMKKYDRLCSIFLNMAKDENIKRKMERNTLRWTIW